MGHVKFNIQLWGVVLQFHKFEVTTQTDILRLGGGAVLGNYSELPYEAKCLKTKHGFL